MGFGEGLFFSARQENSISLQQRIELAYRNPKLPPCDINKADIVLPTWRHNPSSAPGHYRSAVIQHGGRNRDFSAFQDETPVKRVVFITLLPVSLKQKYFLESRKNAISGAYESFNI